ncbi:hypothetical protein SVIOM342S_09508 [Streptomyces violaceorubidus]
MGIVCGIPAVLAAWVFSAWIGRRIFVPVPQDMVEAAEEAKQAVIEEQRKAGVAPTESPVALGTVLGIIGTPLVLILAATFSSIALDPSTLRSVIEFFGNPFVALTIALLLAYYLLGIRRGWSPRVPGDRLDGLAEAGRQHPAGGRRRRGLRRRAQGQRRRPGTLRHLQRRRPAGDRPRLPDLRGAAGRARARRRWPS